MPQNDKEDQNISKNTAMDLSSETPVRACSGGNSNVSSWKIKGQRLTDFIGEGTPAADLPSYETFLTLSRQLLKYDQPRA